MKSGWKRRMLTLVLCAALVLSSGNITVATDMDSVHAASVSSGDMVQEGDGTEDIFGGEPIAEETEAAETEEVVESVEADNSVSSGNTVSGGDLFPEFSGSYTDGEVCVNVYAPQGVLPAGAEVHVAHIADEDGRIGELLFAQAEAEGRELWDYYGYNVQLLREGQPISFEGTVTVRIQINGYTANADTRVYALNRGSLENMGAAVENGAAVMQTGSFGEFVVADIFEVAEEVFEGQYGENYTQAAPFMPPVGGYSAFRKMMRTKAAAEDDNGLELGKTASYNETTGKTTITLEAYTTGTVKTSQKSIPTDIVLVLDQSGSMRKWFTTAEKVEYEPVYNTQRECTYFYKTRRGQYVELKQSIDGDYYYGDNNKVDPPSLSNPYYIIKGAVTRKEALQEAAANFIAEVSSDAEKNSVNHRIAVVGFASGKEWNENDYNYQNTEVFVGSNQYRYGTAAQGQYKNALQDMSTVMGLANVGASINAIAAEGGTLTNLGMEMAKGIFDANPVPEGETRNRVVVMITDGEPGWSGFDKRMAEGAIRTAKDMKDDGATIYTVSVMPGADPNGDKNADKFMRYVSSLYPDATGMDRNEIGTPVPPENGNYYMTAQDMDALSNIFESIFDNISTPKIDLGEETEVKDIVSDYFKLPEGMTPGEVRLFTAACTGKDVNGYTFGGRTSAEGVTAAIDQGTKTVSVKGFDYTENFVTVTDKGEARGKKLIIEFEVDTLDGFIGGNQVPTNGAESGVYDKDGNLVEYFEQPDVDVPLKYLFDTLDDSIYAGDAWNNTDIFIDKNGDVISYRTAENGTKYSLGGINNEFVTITYTVTEADGKAVGSYTVPAGAAAGSWNSLHLDTTVLEKDAEYTISVAVTPTNAGTQTAINPGNTSALHVFQPTVNCHDKTIFLGENVNLNDCVAVTEWNCSCKDEAARALLEGDAPELSLTLQKADGGEITDAAAYAPEKEADIQIVKVIRTDKNREMPGAVIEAAELKCIDGCIDKAEKHSENRDFTIHVAAGSIELAKTITEMDEKHGNPIFTFKITGTKGDVYYQTVEFTQVETDKYVGKLTRLPKGTYTVEELETLRYKVSEIKSAGVEKYPCDVTVDGTESAVVRIGDTLEKRNAKIAFTNERTVDGFDSDTGLLVNGVTMKEDGGYEFAPQIKNQ